MSRAQRIAIDGAVAVGKSTVGRLIARRLGYQFVDTGVLYRALTWKALELGIDLDDVEGLTKLSLETEFELTPDSSVLVDGRDVSDQVRKPEVEARVSLVSVVAGVRKAMVAKQRAMAEERVVMVGRDIGTVVIPDADLKLYLVASPEERARRRYLEMAELGEAVDYATILSDLVRRDRIDSERTTSPLRPAPDAMIIDTDGIGPEEVVAEILQMTG